MKYALMIYGERARTGRRADRGRAAGDLRASTSPSREAPGILGGAELQPTRHRDDRARPRRRDPHDRRPVRRDEGGARRLLPDRGRRPRRRRSRSRRGSRPREHGGASRCARWWSADQRSTSGLPRRVGPRRSRSLIGFLGDFDLAEEAAQEAFAIAAERWPRDGDARQPRRLARDDGAQPRDRPDPPGARARARRRELLAAAGRNADEDEMDDRRSPTSGSS